ncbi:MAG: MarR family winged helix-turn-helix transcriptional regulator [Myxococcota bacterium]
MAKRTGLTGPQRLALRIIGAAPSISSGELARILHVHPSTLTGVLQRLESQGLIVRSRDAHDGRRALLSLTRAGEKLSLPVEFSVEGAVKKLLKQVGEGEAEVTQRLILRLADELLEGTVAGERDE